MKTVKLTAWTQTALKTVLKPNNIYAGIDICI